MSQQKPEQEGTAQRRQFLKTLGLAGGAAAAVAVSSQAVADVQTQDDAQPEKQGYRETEHVRSYYKAARI